MKRVSSLHLMSTSDNIPTPQARRFPIFRVSNLRHTQVSMDWHVCYQQIFRFAITNTCGAFLIAVVIFSSDMSTYSNSKSINIHLLQDPLDSYRGFIYANPLPPSTQHFSFSHFRSVVPLCCHQPHLSWVMLWIVPQKEPVPWYLKWWVDDQAHWSHQAHWHPPRLWHTEWDPSHSGIKEQSLSHRPPPI